MYRGEWGGSAMTRVLLTSVALVALAVPASAADLRTRRPPPAPAPARVVVAPVFTWTGFYIGGHAGWSRLEGDSVLANAVAGIPAGTVFETSQDGFLGGAQAGFNWQVSQLVFGVEGQISWTDLGRDATVTGGVPLTTANVSTDVNFVATVAGRLGVALGNTLIYGKGGVAFLDWDSKVAFSGPVSGTFVNGDTATGWMVGGGLEYAFTPNWSAKVEYNFMNFDSVQMPFNVGGGAAAVDRDVDMHVAKFGINYRFGGFAPAAPPPVVGKY
jgi:outer membrane immunogenic protein